MRISDGSSDVCSSDLLGQRVGGDRGVDRERDEGLAALGLAGDLHSGDVDLRLAEDLADRADHARAVDVGEERQVVGGLDVDDEAVDLDDRSEEHTSELQSLMRISYAVFCLKKKKIEMQLQPK